MKLIEIELIVIEKKLKQAGLSYAPLYHEILDHFCCLVETKLLEGHSFKKAVEISLDTLSPERIASCQNETKYLLNRRQTIMKRITIATCGLAASCILITTVLTAQEHPSIMPLGSVKITSPFGERVHPISKKQQHHRGVDLKATIGTPVMATADGTVIKLEEQPQGYGKFVVIAHADNYQTKYAQLSEFKVALGDKVKMGHIIGLVGSSGASTAPHLHYEVIRDDRAIDPLTTLEDS